MREKINLPIYGGTIHFIVNEDIQEVAKEFNIDFDLSNFGAFTYKIPDLYNNYLIVLENENKGILIHEIIHLVNFIYKDCNMKIDLENDEPQAYLTQYLFETLNYFL